MSTNVKDQKPTETPKKGEVYRCAKCGMALEVTKGCGCKDGEHVFFQCCGQTMKKV